MLFVLCLSSAYQIVVEELHPHRTKRETGAMECYQVPVTYQTALSGGSPYYFAAELPPGNLPEPAPFTVGDNRTYQGFWNPPLAPRKGYNIYFQAMSSVEKVSANPPFLPEGVTDVPLVTIRAAGVGRGRWWQWHGCNPFVLWQPGIRISRCPCVTTRVQRISWYWSRQRNFRAVTLPARSITSTAPSPVQCLRPSED